MALASTVQVLRALMEESQKRMGMYGDGGVVAVGAVLVLVSK